MHRMCFSTKKSCKNLCHVQTKCSQFWNHKFIKIRKISYFKLWMSKLEFKIWNVKFLCRLALHIPSWYVYHTLHAITLGTCYYAMVAGIPHDIAFGMCHVGCKGIPHGHMVCFCDHVVCFYTTTENFNLGYLKVRKE